MNECLSVGRHLLKLKEKKKKRKKARRSEKRNAV